jgi:hypothetical protein
MACMLMDASLICINVSVHSFTRKLGFYVHIHETGKARLTQDQKQILSRDLHLLLLIRKSKMLKSLCLKTFSCWNT